MADTDPPDKIDDGKAPRDRHIDAPDTDAAHEQVGDRNHQHHREKKSDGEAGQPTPTGALGQDNGADFLRDRGKGMAWCDERRTVVNTLIVFGSHYVFENI